MIKWLKYTCKILIITKFILRQKVHSYKFKVKNKKEKHINWYSLYIYFYIFEKSNVSILKEQAINTIINETGENKRVL